MQTHKIQVTLIALLTFLIPLCAHPSPQSAEALGTINQAPNNPNAPVPVANPSLISPPPELVTTINTSPSPFSDGLFTCDQPNWQGKCQWRRATWLTCRSDPSLQTARAIGPDQGNYCTIYPSSDCSGEQYMVPTYPGVYNLTYWEQYTGASWKVGSIKCFYKTMFDVGYGAASKEFLEAMEKSNPGFSMGSGVKDVYLFGMRAPSSH